LFEFTSLQWQGSPAEVVAVTLTHDWSYINATTSFSADSAAVAFTGNSLEIGPGSGRSATSDAAVGNPTCIVTLELRRIDG
jgi:hypothetical protein